MLKWNQGSFSFDFLRRPFDKDKKGEEGENIDLGSELEPVKKMPLSEEPESGEVKYKVTMSSENIESKAYQEQKKLQAKRRGLIDSADEHRTEELKKEILELENEVTAATGKSRVRQQMADPVLQRRMKESQERRKEALEEYGGPDLYQSALKKPPKKSLWGKFKGLFGR